LASKKGVLFEAVAERLEGVAVVPADAPLITCCVTRPKSAANPSADAIAVRRFKRASRAY